MESTVSDFPESLAAKYECLYSTKVEPVRVWVCRQGDEQVLVKVTEDPNEANQLENEYAVMNRCEHLPVCFPRAIEFGHLPGNRTYLVRSCIEGSSVEQLVDSCEGQPGLSRDESVRIVRDVLTGLEALHGMQPPVIHRDIKPQNVIVDRDHRCHLVDFGIARSYSKDGKRDTNVLGTRQTAPPEQYGYRQTDQRSDIYSTGILLRYCLTGEYSDEADAELPEDLRTVVKKATAFDPDNRYQTAKEMLDALDAIEKSGEKPAKKRHSARQIIPAAAVFVCILLICLVQLIWHFPVEADEAGRFDRQGGYHFHEPLIETAVRQVLGNPEGPLTAEMLANVRSIHIFGKQIYETEAQVDFLAEFVWMKDSEMNSSGLWKENGGITSLEDIRVLTGLEELCLYGQSIEDISALEGTRIPGLGLGYNPLTDLSPLYENEFITYLNIGCLSLKSLEGIETLTNLRTLNISGTQVDDFSPIVHSSIRDINIFETPLRDESILAEMPVLESVTINKLTDKLLSTFKRMENLKELTVTHANGFPIESLNGLEGLQKLYYYTDEMMTVQDAPLQFPNLRWVDMKNLQLQSLRCVSEMPQLETLLIYASQVDDYHGLENLSSLSLICCTYEQMEAMQAMYPDRKWQYAY